MLTSILFTPSTTGYCRKARDKIPTYSL